MVVPVGWKRVLVGGDGKGKQRYHTMKKKTKNKEMERLGVGKMGDEMRKEEGKENRRRKEATKTTVYVLPNCNN